jgi:uncharacterized protein YdhG (YjbR/CyaY superfamily)
MSQIKLQIPMDKNVRDGLEKKAKKLGFDSAQAYVRFWAKAEVDGRDFYIGEPERITPAIEKIIKETEEEIARNDTYGTFETAEDAINFLNKNNPLTLGIENEI